MLALPAPVQRLPTRLHQSAPIRSSTSSTHIGTLTTPMATNGCTLRVQLFSLTRTRESTSLLRRELRAGTLPSCPRPPEQFLRRFLQTSGLYNLTGRLLPSSTTLPPTQTATSPFFLQRPIFSTSLTPSGMATIPSSTIQRAAASTA